MRSSFQKIFGGGVWRPARPTPRVRLGIEELNQKVLPSCTGGGASSSAAGAASQLARFASQSSSNFDSFERHGGGHDCGGDHGAEHATLAASVSNSSGATGTVTFNESNGSLFVTVKGATASTTLDVAVTDNGTTTTVGTVTTDASGNGHAKFTGVTVAAGDTVTIGSDITGTFAQVKFTSTLTSPTSATGVSGSARFNSVRNSLQVSVSGAAAGTAYNVSINGTVVGQFTTNANGRGRFHLSALPTGVSITSGSTISIADTSSSPTTILSGTFA